MSLDILRQDLDGGDDEVLSFSSKQLRSFAKRSNVLRTFPGSLITDLVVPVKKVGVYRILRVLEKDDLHIRDEKGEAWVVQCPDASLRMDRQPRCRGGLSDLRLHVSGVPPLRVRYSKNVEGKRTGFSVENAQSEGVNLSSQPVYSEHKPLTGSTRPYVQGARRQNLTLPINETLNARGEWSYAIEDIQDGLNNTIKFNTKFDSRRAIGQRSGVTQQSFQVHDKPLVSIVGCSAQQPLKIALNQQTELPIQLSSTSADPLELPHSISYTFVPTRDLEPSCDTQAAGTRHFKVRNPHEKPKIDAPGLYQLLGVETEYCTGEVMEPSTCLLTNPPKPHVKITARPIADDCAGNSIGLLVDLDLIGSPPFTIHYEELDHDTRQTHRRTVEIREGLRHQMRLEPRKAGKFSYHFLQISDAVYDRIVLNETAGRLTQVVRPPASAQVLTDTAPSSICNGAIFEVPIRLYGEAPWDLSYDIIHANHRQSLLMPNITTNLVTIATSPLTTGGEYVIALTSIQDRLGCKSFLALETTVLVRYQRPTAAFARIGGTQKLMQIAGHSVDLPVRLSGRGPWKLEYRNPALKVESEVMRLENDVISAELSGEYEIMAVNDSECPGTVEQSARRFVLQSVPQPEVLVARGEMKARGGNAGEMAVYKLDQVCQGDENSVELSLRGSPPFSLTYDMTVVRTAERATSKAILRAGTHSVILQMDTFEAGLHSYKLHNIADYNYDKTNPKVSLEQIVWKRPKAWFVRPHHIHHFCKDDHSREEGLVIQFDGPPPYSLELAVSHGPSSRVEVVRIPKIETTSYRFTPPERILSVGQHVINILKVTDGRGCYSSVQSSETTAKVVIGTAPMITPDDTLQDICVGDRVSYTLSGSPPFMVEYSFNGIAKRVEERSTTFRRLAERPGNFTITSVTDTAQPGKSLAKGICRLEPRHSKFVHQLPSVKVSRGLDAVADIREGSEVDLEFTFEGQPPFEFTYTRSHHASHKGEKPKVVETRHERSDSHRKIVKASDEGVYEIIAVRDAYCGFAK